MRRWFAADGEEHAVELSLRTGDRYILGFPLAVGRKLLAFERWDREALVPISVELVPFAMLDSVRRHASRMSQIEALPDLETRRSFFGARTWLRGIDLDDRGAALESLAREQRFVYLDVREADGQSTLRGRVRHTVRGVVLFEWIENGQDATSTLILLRASHVVRVGFGSAACELAARRPPKAGPEFDELVDALRVGLATAGSGRQAPLLHAALLGHDIDVGLQDQRSVDGRLVKIGDELFGVESRSASGARVLACHPLDEIESVEIATFDADDDTALPIEEFPDLDDLPRALREAQRLWGGMTLEILDDGPSHVLAEVLEVGERGVFIRPADALCDPETLGHVWVDLGAVLSFARPSRGELQLLRRGRRSRG